MRIYTACGGEGSNCASMAIKISDVCLGSHCWLICLVCSLNSCCIYPPPGAKMLSKFKFLKILWLFCAWRGKHWYFGGRAALLSWLLPEFSNRDMSWLDCIHEQICSLSIASFQKISKNFFNKILDWKVVVTEIFCGEYEYEYEYETGNERNVYWFLDSWILFHCQKMWFAFALGAWL